MSYRSEIAKQFDLPERQSKLNTMLREEGLKDEQVYCICRTADVTRFMIGCDRCEEWYHGDCIRVTEHQAGRIRKFYCERCRQKFPGLEIKYKQKKPHHRPQGETAPASSQKHTKHSSSRSNRPGGGGSSSRRCGECEACYQREDCGRCEHCKDMPKFGGPNKFRQKCKKRQCRNFVHLSKKSASVTITSSTTSSTTTSSSSSSKKHSTTSSSSTSSSSSSTPAKNQPEELPSKTGTATTANASTGTTTTSATVGSKSSLVRVGGSTSSTTTSATATSAITVITTVAATSAITSPATTTPTTTTSATSSSTPTSTAPLTTTTPTTPTVLKDRNDGRMEEDSREAKKRPLPSHDNSQDRKEKESKPHARKPKKDPVGGSKKRKTRHPSSDSDSEPELPLTVGRGDPWAPRQCFGPQCMQAARTGSKYCSEDCGLKLAQARIYSVLPQRIQEWKMSQCVAEERDQKELDRIRKQQLEAHSVLQQLDQKHLELDRLVERNKSVTIDPQADEEGEEDGGEGSSIYCVTCGHEIQTRKAVKHMETCFNRLESQTSFGSIYKTRIEGNNMFCDYYNPSNHTYCKRLRVMCPEHTKEPKVHEKEVCGAPLIRNLFEETGEICKASKKKCLRHYCWEKFRRAEIDMERVRQWLKLDELFEQERVIRQAMTNRAGVLGLMLHSTYDHELAQKLQQSQQYEQQKIQQQSQQYQHKHQLQHQAGDQHQHHHQHHHQHQQHQVSGGGDQGSLKVVSDRRQDDHAYGRSSTAERHWASSDHQYSSSAHKPAGGASRTAADQKQQRSGGDSKYKARVESDHRYSSSTTSKPHHTGGGRQNTAGSGNRQVDIAQQRYSGGGGGGGGSGGGTSKDYHIEHGYHSGSKNTKAPQSTAKYHTDHQYYNRKHK